MAEVIGYWVTSAIEAYGPRSEEHTSELQSQSNLVCRLLLEKKNNHNDDQRQFAGIERLRLENQVTRLRTEPPLHLPEQDLALGIGLRQAVVVDLLIMLVLLR